MKFALCLVLFCIISNSTNAFEDHSANEKKHGQGHEHYLKCVKTCHANACKTVDRDCLIKLKAFIRCLSYECKGEHTLTCASFKCGPAGYQL